MVKADNKIPDRQKTTIKDNAPLRPLNYPADLCMAWGTCSAGCPITGEEDFDPRKIVRMVLSGRARELVESKLPWLCTMCGKCEYGCHMGVNIINMIRTARGMVERDDVPGMIVLPCHSCHGQIMQALSAAEMDIPVKYLWEIVADALIVEP